MNVREQQVNAALRGLDEMHRHGRIGRDAYRQQRRRLLDSLSDATEMAGRDTVRRAVPECDAPAARRTAVAAPTREPGGTGDTGDMGEKAARGASLWRLAICVAGLGALACAAWCWFASGR